MIFTGIVDVMLPDHLSSGNQKRFLGAIVARDWRLYHFVIADWRAKEAELPPKWKRRSADSSSSRARHAKLLLAIINNIRLSNSSFHPARDCGATLTGPGT
jgi:hypothetical protein